MSEHEHEHAGPVGTTRRAVLQGLGLGAAGAEGITVRREPLTEGWSIHELGTARMGHDPKTSVTNSFGQTHDVKNLFLADGSTFVSASCQNPTWTIMALCWRGMDFLRDGLKRGEV